MSNIIDQIKNAEAAKRKALSGLHKELGYSSAQALADAILQADSSGLARFPRAAKSSGAAKTNGAAKADGAATEAPAKSGRGRRVPDETRKAIAEALKSGEVGAQLTKKYGVSYNIVHEIKTSLGMVRRAGRARKASKAAKK
jgi:hypothetical protein